MSNGNLEPFMVHVTTGDLSYLYSGTKKMAFLVTNLTELGTGVKVRLDNNEYSHCLNPSSSILVYASELFARIENDEPENSVAALKVHLIEHLS